MGIVATDIKLRKSQRLTDFPDGGGRMVAAEVVDGQLNNLFPDISTQDRVAGRVSMRKAFVHVDTDNTDLLYGAVGVIIDPPEDGNVSMSMFSTGQYADTRTDARNRIENYITKGVESRYTLFGDHFAGQRSIMVYTMQDSPNPEINETYCLSVEAAGYVANIQYVRVEEMLSRVTQTFVDDNSEFQRDVIIIGITTPLLFDFSGQEVKRYTQLKPPTRVRKTNVADASSYYSIKPLTANPEAGDTTVQVEDPYIHLVPTTQAETPVVDVLAGMGALAYIEAGEPGSLGLAFTTSYGAGALVTRFVGSPMTKGSVSVTVGGATLTDDGRGTLRAETESLWSGSVDYLAGSITLSHSAGFGSTPATLTATPAGPVLMQGYSQYIDISELNRQLNYVMQLEPFPYAATVTVDYMALGKWIRLTDNGTGQLVGNPGQGGGSVNYATGSLIATLGALPDINSAIIVSYGTGIVTERRDQDITLKPPTMGLQVPTIPNTAVRPGSVSVTYTVSGSPQIATDTASPGVLKIGAVEVGAVDYSAATVQLRPAVMPDIAAPVEVQAAVVETENDTFVPVAFPANIVNLDLASEVIPGSFKATWLAQQMVAADNPQKNPPGSPTPTQVAKTVAVTVVDDGAGNIVCTQVGSKAMSDVLGAITYATGIASWQITQLFANTLPAYWWEWVSDAGGDNWRLRGPAMIAGLVTTTVGTPINATWQVEGAPAGPVIIDYPPPGDPLPPPPENPPPIVLPPQGEPEPPPVNVPPPAPIELDLDLTPGTDDPIVPGSVRFIYRGKTYVDRSGALYHTIDPVSGSGTYAGTIDYATGKLDIVKWEKGAGANTLNVVSLLVKFNEMGQQFIAFRTPGAPLRPGSFIFRATSLSGELLTATADLNGNILGDGVSGEIDWRTGFARIGFSYMVPAAGNEAESWYDPSEVVGGNVRMPMAINPATAYFGTVVYRNIPLNPSLLGLDPVRLPEDGRVVVFKPGQTVLIHHTQETEVASPTPGQLVNLGRPHLTRVEVRDSAGTPILSSWYTVNKTAGTVTFSDPLNLTGYTLPVVIRDRIEDRVLVADAQITGEIAINRGLSHDYPDGGFLSTCLILGEQNGSQDLQARVENIFDQQTWTAVFSDARIGNGTDAQYNDVVYPILVDNSNAITERWAINFTSASNYEVIGEASGIIATGNLATECAPLNPRTGAPYFTIPAAGWGAGWSTGNVLRFNTVGGLAPVWFIRTVLAGEAEAPYDGFRYETIGDANP
jgi:hypothetical protein